MNSSDAWFRLTAWTESRVLGLTGKRRVIVVQAKQTKGQDSDQGASPVTEME
jgi:hypothetical protein